MKDLVWPREMRIMAMVVAAAVVLVMPKTSRAGIGTHFEKVEKFIKSDKRCVFAAAKVFNKPIPGAPGKGNAFDIGELELHTVLCVWDTFIKQGTIDQDVGCAVGYYNYKENEYELPSSDAVVRGECDKKRVAEALLKKNSKGLTWWAAFKRLASSYEYDSLKVLVDKYDALGLLSK